MKTKLKNCDAIGNAANWLRVKLDIPTMEVIDEEFEHEFNCKIHYGSSMTDFESYIEFNSEEDAMMFLLRWS